MPKLSKDVLYAGTWRLNDGRLFKCAPSEIPHFAKRMQEMLDCGLNIPLTWEHQENIYAMSQEEMQRRLADQTKATLGWAEKADAKPGVLHAEVNVPGAENAAKLNEIRFVSPTIKNNYVDSKGRLWPGKSIIQLAVTPIPVQHEQRPFRGVADAPMNLSMAGFTPDEPQVPLGTDTAHPPLGTSDTNPVLGQGDTHPVLGQGDANQPLGSQVDLAMPPPGPGPHVGEGLRTHGGLAKSHATLALNHAMQVGHGKPNYQATRLSEEAHNLSHSASDPAGHKKAAAAHDTAARYHESYAYETQGDEQKHHLQAHEHHWKAYRHHQNEAEGRPTNLSTVSPDTVELANARLHTEGRTQVNTKVPSATAVAIPLEHHEIAKHYAGLAMQHAKTTQGPALHKSFMAHEATKKAKSAPEHLQAASAHVDAYIAHAHDNLAAARHHYDAATSHQHAAKAMMTAEAAGGKKQGLRMAPTPKVGQAVKLSAKAKSKGRAKIQKVMDEFKKGKLKTSAGTKVTNPKQAVAIGYSEARRRGYKLSNEPSEYAPVVINHRSAHVVKRYHAGVDPKEVDKFLDSPDAKAYEKKHGVKLLVQAGRHYPPHLYPEHGLSDASALSMGDSEARRRGAKLSLEDPGQIHLYTYRGDTRQLYRKKGPQVRDGGEDWQKVVPVHLDDRGLHHSTWSSHEAKADHFHHHGVHLAEDLEHHKSVPASITQHHHGDLAVHGEHKLSNADSTHGGTYGQSRPEHQHHFAAMDHAGRAMGHVPRRSPGHEQTSAAHQATLDAHDISTHIHAAGQHMVAHKTHAGMPEDEHAFHRFASSSHEKAAQSHLKAAKAIAKQHNLSQGATMADDKDTDDGWKDDFPSLVKVVNEEFGGNVLGDDVTEDNFAQRFIAAMRAADLCDDDEGYTPPDHGGDMPKEVQTGLLTLSQQDKQKYDTEMLSLKATAEAEKKRADAFEHRMLTQDRAAAKDRVNKLVPKVLSKKEADEFCTDIDKEMVKLSLEDGHKYPCIIRLEAFEQVAARMPNDRFNLSQVTPKEIVMPKTPDEEKAESEKNGKAEGAGLAAMVGYTRK